MKIRYVVLPTFLLCQLALPQWVFAYIGPGAGISAIGTVVAFFGAILLAIVGFVWYPVKRLLSRRKKKESNEQETNVS